MSTLSKYTGPWGKREAAHLLRRCSFGASPSELTAAVKNGLDATLTSVLKPVAPLAPPTHPNDDSQWVPPTGKVWTTMALVTDQTKPELSTAYDLGKGSAYYNNPTKQWWLKQMIHGPIAIHEKLTLFWSNHFATEMQIVQNAIFSFELLAYMRANAFGNVKDMARRVTLDAAMLRYLNGNVNTKGSPNENYARELMELFTIGKGPLAGPDDYTTYTEQDVRAAARVLTGWRDFGTRDLTLTAGDRDYRDNEPRTAPMFADNPNVVFIAANHDTTDKAFSARFGNRVIKGRTGQQAGIDELNELLDMLFEQPATARYIVTRLYRFFVNTAITDDVRRDIIDPLAADLRSNGYVVGPVLKRLLSSEHFFDSALLGCQLRSPADVVVGTLRSTPTWIAPTDKALANRLYGAFMSSLIGQQMDFVDPNSVAGWEAYYQAPDYDRMWLTTATLPLRNGYTDGLLTNNAALGRKPILDTVEFVKGLTDVGDPLGVIEQINEVFFAVPFSEATTMMLVEEVLMNGGRYYEWTALWNAHMQNPTNGPARTAVKTPLDRLFKYMFRMAEYQLG